MDGQDIKVYETENGPKNLVLAYANNSTDGTEESNKRLNALDLARGLHLFPGGNRDAYRKAFVDAVIKYNDECTIYEDMFMCAYLNLGVEKIQANAEHLGEAGTQNIIGFILWYRSDFDAKEGDPLFYLQMEAATRAFEMLQCDIDSEAAFQLKMARAWSIASQICIQKPPLVGEYLKEKTLERMHIGEDGKHYYTHQYIVYEPKEKEGELENDEDPDTLKEGTSGDQNITQSEFKVADSTEPAGKTNDSSDSSSDSDHLESEYDEVD